DKPKNVVVEKTLEPDVWVEPKIVFTVEADEITKKKDSKYLSLRFPRLVEWGRDKQAVQATTVKELEEMYGG
ncbi:MAG: putative DNA ligase, partial [candidate division WS6 bacterium 36_33]